MLGNIEMPYNFNKAELLFIENCINPEYYIPITSWKYPKRPLSAIYTMVKKGMPSIFEDEFRTVPEYAEKYRTEDGLIVGVYREGYSLRVKEIEFMDSLLAIWISEYTCVSPKVNRRIKPQKWQRYFQLSLRYYYCGWFVSNLPGKIIKYANERTIDKYDALTWQNEDYYELNYQQAVSLIEIMHECKLSLKG